MNNLRKIFIISSLNFKKWITTPKIYVLGLLLIMVINNTIEPFNKLSSELNIPNTIWVFPFLNCDIYCLIFVMLGIVLLFCDAPFLDNLQPYVLMRCSRNVWLLGQVMYIAIASAVYFLFIMLLSIVLLFPNLTFSWDWGKILGSLSQQVFEADFSVPYKILIKFTPVSAMLLSFLLNWLVGIFLGTFMLFVNSIFKVALGNLLACSFIGITLITREVVFSVSYFSPVSWAALDLVDFSFDTMYPSSVYVFVVLISFIILFSVLANLVLKKKAIEFHPIK